MRQEGFTDIHSHILPGADDGAANTEEALQMLRFAAREGIRRIILTPHQKPERHCVSAEETLRRTEELALRARQQGIEVQLYSGAELLYRSDLKQCLQEGSVCTLAGSRYLLTEFLPDQDWPYIRDGLYRLTCAGYFPIVAHAERCCQLMQRTERIQELIDMGGYIQVNAGSLTGKWGFSMKRMTVRLVQDRLVHFIGTDAHRAEGKRTPELAKCARWLYRKAGAVYADELLWKNAEAILTDSPLSQ